MRKLALLLLVVACGGSGSAFGPTYPDNQASAIDQVTARLRANPAPDPAPVAVGLTAEPQLYAVDLTSGAQRWKVAAEHPASGPQIGGPLVFLHETRGVVARDLATGAERFVVEDDALHLAGAGGEGEWSAMALTTGGGVGAQSKLVIARGGRVQHELSVPFALGAPTVAAGMVFVPWATQNLSVLDASSGDEIARVRITDTPVARAFRVGDDLYFGQRGVFRFTSSVVSGTRADSAYFEPMDREIPGDPALMIDPYRPAPGPDSAVHHIRFVWRPGGEGETMRFADDTVYAVFYRFVFALDPEADAVRWVYQHPQDIVGAAAHQGGITLADQTGGFAFVGIESGRREWSASVDAAPTVVEVRPGAHVPRGTPEGPALSLHDQLVAAAQNTDSRLVPARKLAIHMLNSLEDPDVTGQLIVLCEDRRSPAPVRMEACARLAERTTGKEQVLAALERHERFLEGTVAPPVGPLARAAVAMEAREAAPALVAHLNDPATADDQLTPLLQALRELEATDAAESVRAFLALYHSEARDETLFGVMEAAAQTAVALEPEPAAELLERLGEDPLAAAPVRGKLREVLDAYRAAQAEAEAETAAEAAEAEEEASEGEADDADADDEDAEAEEAQLVIPEEVTLPMVERALEAVRPEMTRCLGEHERRMRSARIVLVLAGDGSIQLVSVVPADLQRCLEPLVRSVEFPANSRNTRQQLTYTFRR